jgi:hypothetical protein
MIPFGRKRLQRLRGRLKDDTFWRGNNFRGCRGSCSLARVLDALGVKHLVAQFGWTLTSTCLGWDCFHLPIGTSKRCQGATTLSNQLGGRSDVLCIYLSIQT